MSHLSSVDTLNPFDRRQSQARSARAAISRCLLPMLAAWGIAMGGLVHADALPDTVERIEPSIVSVATFQSTRSPRLRHLGTGFVIEDGRLVVTNHHVLPDFLDTENRERLVAVSGSGRNTQIHDAQMVVSTRENDLALLRISGPALPALALGDSSTVRVGEKFAFTGFPIGMILGLYPATHRATVSAHTPLAIPARTSRELDERRVAALRRDPPMIFQLDATAYPGNSGSPLYRIGTGEVVGIINQVFVQGGREAAVGSPSGISYAIPSAQLAPLLRQYRAQ